MKVFKVVFFLLLIVVGLLLTATMEKTYARTEEIVDSYNKDLKITMQSPDDWNSGRISSSALIAGDWRLNGLFATNFANKLFSNEEPLAIFLVVNLPSLANFALPFGQQSGLLSYLLSQYVKNTMLASAMDLLVMLTRYLLAETNWLK